MKLNRFQFKLEKNGVGDISFCFCIYKVNLLGILFRIRVFKLNFCINFFGINFCINL